MERKATALRRMAVAGVCLPLLLVAWLPPAESERLRLAGSGMAWGVLEPLSESEPLASAAEAGVDAGGEDGRGSSSFLGESTQATSTEAQEAKEGEGEQVEVMEGASNEAAEAKTVVTKKPETTSAVVGSGSGTSESDIAALATALSRHRHQLVKTSCIKSTRTDEPSELGALRVDERQCRTSVNAIVIVDGGSTKTRAQLYTVVVESCPFVGRRVLPESIRFKEEGKGFRSLREVLEDWLAENAGPDWASKPFDSNELLKNYKSMQAAAKTLVEDLLQDATALIRKHLSEEEQAHSKVAGIPVFCHSTAGVRDIHDWYREGLFTAIRKAINSSRGYEGFLFFTNEDLTRPITGEEEGLNAFLTANHRLGNLDELAQLQRELDREVDTEETKLLRMKMHEGLVGIIEVGGASMQIAFPVSSSAGRPAFVHVTNLHKDGYLTSAYPSIDVMSISFMQLGASSAGGVFMNAFCSNPDNREGTVCKNPCLPKGFRQDCSTGRVQISKEGNVTVAKGVGGQRLRPVATYCSGTNPEIREKLLNRFSCLAARVDPEKTLEERLTIDGCVLVEGTGDFDKCLKAVDHILVSPAAPLPANHEATYTGFDTPGQIFEFLTASSSMYVTGKALVIPVKSLEELGLLKSPYTGDTCALRDAARVYCAAPMVRSSNGGLSLRVPVGGKEVDVPLNGWNYEACLKLAMAQALVEQLNRNEVRPQNIFFEADIIHPETKENMGEFGWHVGILLKHILRDREWARDAYELGIKHTLQDRMQGMQ